MTRMPPYPPADNAAQGREGDGGGMGADVPSHRAISIAIFGFFALASLAVLALSWPGLQTARHTRRAELALEEGRWEEAARHLAQITGRFPGAWLRQRQLGDCLLELGRAEPALAAYEASLRHEPDQELRSRIGRALYLLDPKNPDAARLMEEGLRSQPAEPRANFYVAILREEQGRYREAAYCFLGATADPLWFERSRPHIERIRERLTGDRG